MEPLALCKVETVEIALFGSRGVIKTARVTGHRYLDFAVHRIDTADLFRERWRITHLPSGRCAAHNFGSIEPALAAMIEIARLRNDWACVDDAGTSNDTAAKVEEIVKRHDPRARLGDGRKRAAIENRLNGYADASA